MHISRKLQWTEQTCDTTIIPLHRNIPSYGDFALDLLPLQTAGLAGKGPWTFLPQIRQQALEAISGHRLHISGDLVFCSVPSPLSRTVLRHLQQQASEAISEPPTLHLL